jgi:beta-N-acetylhexosaminidase
MALAAAAASIAIADPTAGRRQPDPTSGLSLRQLAGQRVIYAYRGLAPPASLLATIRAGEAAGVILYSANLASDAQIHAVTDELQTAARASKLHRRLLILTDQEGGEVRRLPGAPVLSEKQIGASRNAAALAAEAGHGAGVNLRSAGIDVNLAPVLDVYRASSDFIDRYQRSYSQDPARVARLAARFIAAQQAIGVAATAKHFPGLGAAARAQNTDAGPVTLQVSSATLRSVDELPYRAAIGAGVKLVMSSWATYPALDPSRPAGLSPVVIETELRHRLGFRGVTITDSIDAGALRSVSLARRSVLAAAAGEDLILGAATDPAGNSPSEGAAVVSALVEALRTRRLAMAPFRAAVAQVLALRAAL